MNIGLIKKTIKQLVKELETYKNGSKWIKDREILNQFVENPDFPFIVSFPRTGSHWLRMVMELYFQRPSLVRVFYYKNCQDYLALHTHDIELNIYRKNVIYLYRNPSPTIYSQMMYYKENLDDIERVRYWATLYGKHLNKWLLEETESEKKTIVRYENLANDISTEFSKITLHFGLPMNSDKLLEAVDRVSKEEVIKKTKHDLQVINRNAQYERDRHEFMEKNSRLITDLVLNQSPALQKYI